ncbi:MAG: sulfatase [Planctomycetota bacterium]
MILISIDSLRRDGLSSFGNPHPTSPNIDHLAHQGVAFEDAVSTTTWTMPAHHALLRGLYDDVHGAARDQFPPSALQGTPLPELLRRAGYATQGCYSAPYLDPIFGFALGFDSYQPCFHYQTAYEHAADSLSEEAYRELIGKMEDQSHGDSTSASVVQQAKQFLQQWRARPARPFFLFLHFFDVHYDYLPPPPFDAKFTQGRRDLPRRGYMDNPAIKPDMPPGDLAYYRGLYEGEIGWVDDQIGALLKLLLPDDDVIVALVSDHGDEFFEHGQKGHRANLYHETLDVPILFWSTRDRIPRRVSVKSRVRLIDVAPTLLELCGVGVPDQMMGRSLTTLMHAPDSEPHGRSAWAELDCRGRMRALLDGSLKLIGSITAHGEQPRFELYDLAADPGERTNLIAAGDARAQAMGNLYNAMLAQVAERAPSAQGSTQLPSAVRQALDGLAYLADGSKLPALAELRYR